MSARGRTWPQTCRADSASEVLAKAITPDVSVSKRCTTCVATSCTELQHHAPSCNIVHRVGTSCTVLQHAGGPGRAHMPCARTWPYRAAQARLRGAAVVYAHGATCVSHSLHIALHTGSGTIRAAVAEDLRLPQRSARVCGVHHWSPSIARVCTPSLAQRHALQSGLCDVPERCEGLRGIKRSAPCR